MARAVIDVEAFARGVEVLDAGSSVDRLHAIAVPTRVLVGRHDPMCAPQQAYRIAGRIPSAETVVFEASAHMPWLEEEDAFFGVLSDWLRRHPPTAATAATTRHRVPAARGA